MRFKLLANIKKTFPFKSVPARNPRHGLTKNFKELISLFLMLL